MNTLIKKISAAGATLLLLSVGAQATPLTIEYSTHFTDVTASFTDNSGLLRHSLIPLHTEPDDGQEGTLASLYTSVWTEDGGDIESVVISHDSVADDQTTPPSMYIGGADIFVIAGTMIWRYDPSLNSGATWDGWMPLTINGVPALTANDVSAISHVDITGRKISVPDGGASLALLGLSLLGMGGIRRLLGGRRAS